MTTVNYNDGGRYEGEIKDGKRNGKGKYFYADGGRYEGEWKDGKRHGTGKFFRANGEWYEGKWENDVCKNKSKSSEAVSAAKTDTVKQPRDTRKDANYFNDFLVKQRARIEKFTELKNKIVKERGENDGMMPEMCHDLFNMSVHELIAAYSAGKPIEEVRKLFPGVCDLYLKSNTAYTDLCLTLSLCILFSYEKEYLQKIKEKAINAKLIDNFMKFLIQDSSLTVSCKGFPKYEKIGLIENTSDKTAALKEYLTRWYNFSQGEYWYDYHHNQRDNLYFGYWCFEAAAAVKILKLNPDNFADSVYFPQDIFVNKNAKLSQHIDNNKTLTKREFYSKVKRAQPNKEMYDKLFALYNRKFGITALDPSVVAPNGIEFINDGEYLRVLSFDEILNAGEKYKKKFVEFGLIPVFELKNKNIICYDIKKGYWREYDLNENVLRKKLTFGTIFLDDISKITVDALSKENDNYESLDYSFNNWGENGRISFQLSAEQNELPICLENIKTHLAWIKDNKQKFVDAMLEYGIVKLANDWRPCETGGKPFYLLEGKKVEEVITDEVFIKNLDGCDVRGYINPLSDKHRYDFYFYTKSDLFAGHKIEVTLKITENNKKYEIKVNGLAG